MKLSEIEKHYKKELREYKKLLEVYNGRDAIVPEGKYKGRLGVISNIFFDYDGSIFAMVRPYRLAHGPREDLLWEHPDARTYWKISDKDIVE